MNADINFNDGTIILVCPRCRRKHPKRIEETKTALRVACRCGNVVSWEGDLTWVRCYAQPYGITTSSPKVTPRIDAGVARK